MGHWIIAIGLWIYLVVRLVSYFRARSKQRARKGGA
jgi:hypothetical protein